MNKFRNDLLRAEKGRRDWTNQDIADKAGVSVPTVRAVLAGDTSLRFESIEKVANALDVTMQTLFEPQPEPVGASLHAR